MNLDNTSHETFYELWKKGESTDLLVVVEGKEFKCHTAVLCACSDFFKTMMEAKMKESQERVVHLGDISLEIFSTILESMYTEEINLTNENVVDMWYASDQLQMKRVMQECEKFVTGKYLTVETCVPVYCHAKQLTATTILNEALNFICQNFEGLVETDSYLDTSYDTILQIVKSEDLKIESEDSVIEFILKWVCHAPQSTHVQHKSYPSEEHDQKIKPDGHAHKTRDTSGQHEDKSAMHISPQALDLPMSLDVISDIHNSPSTSHSSEQNVTERFKDSEEQATARKDTLREADVKPQKHPRAKHLQKLLRSSRICLANKDVLENLLKHELAEREKDLYKYVFDSLLYKLDVGRRHGSWPEAAIRRRSSDMRHVMVFAESHSNNIMAYYLDGGSMCKWASTPDEATPIDITVYDNCLLLSSYTTRLIDSYTKEYTVDLKAYYGGNWLYIGAPESDQSYNWSPAGCLFAHDHHIYLQNKDTYDRKFQLKRMEAIRFRGSNMWSKENLFPGISEIQEPMSAIPFRQYILAFCYSAVYAIDTIAKRHWRLSSPTGPMNGVVSFNDQKNSYILQRNGKMWKILLTDSAEKVGFESVASLWDFDWEIYGGIFYKSKLFIFGDAHSFQGEGQTCQTSVPGLFENIKYVFIKSCTKCVPMVIK